MLNRRDFVKSTAAGLVGLGAITSMSALQAGEQAAGSVAPSPRFIFLRHSNGTFPEFLTPVSLSAAEKQKEAANEALDLDLNKHQLQDWMELLNPHKKNLAILQGLSAKMCTMSHSTYQSPMAVCKAAERPETIKRASVDVELGRMFPSPFEHIELTCAANKKGIATGFSSIGPKQPNFAFGSPSAAFASLFRAGSDKQDVKADIQLEDSMYSFLSEIAQQKGENLGAIGRTVEKAFGKYNVTVVKSAQTGAPILLWNKDYKWPEDKCSSV